MRNRDFINLRSIINRLPDLNSDDQTILLNDLAILEQAFSDTLSNVSSDQSTDFLKSKLKMVERAQLSVASSNFNNQDDLDLIKSLYEPIFEPEGESLGISFDQSLIDDILLIKQDHQHGGKYTIDEFIKLLLIEKIVDHKQSEKPTIFKYFLKHYGTS